MAELLTPHNDIPAWEHIYVYSKEDLNNANALQKQFYEEYRGAFFDGVYYDLQGNTNYCFILFFDLCNEYENTHHDIDRLKAELSTLGKFYPETTPYATSVLVKAFLKGRRYTEAWNLENQSRAPEIDTIIQFERLLKRSLIDIASIKSLAGISSLTPFGRTHIDEILALTERRIRCIERERKCRFTLIFIRKIKWEKYDLPDYKQYYPNKKEYTYYFDLDNSQVDFRWGTNAVPHTVSHALQAHLRTIVRQSEDEYRENAGLPKIGEGWIGETELYYFIKELLPKCTVLHHARPEWLKPQHLDILIQDYNIALEYQGEQHYRPVDYFGGQESFEANIRRDAVKKEKCDANGCILLCVDKAHTQESIKKSIYKVIKSLSDEGF